MDIERWPEARERLPGKLLWNKRFENNDGVNSEYLGEELPWLRKGQTQMLAYVVGKRRILAWKKGGGEK